MLTTLQESPLRALLKHRAYWQWSMATQCSRLPPLMTALAFTVASEQVSGSFRVGALMVTAYTVAQALVGPVAGRWQDRIGPGSGAARQLAIAVVPLIGLAFALSRAAPAPVPLILAAVAGAVAAGVGGALRSVLSETVPERLLAPALALDATLLELVVVSAPLIVAAAVVATPLGGVMAMVVATSGAALLVSKLPAGDLHTDRACAEHEERTAYWTNPRFLFWFLVSIVFGALFGTVETGALPLVSSLGGGAGSAAALIAVISVSSALSGLAYAALSHHLRQNMFWQARIMLGVWVAAGVGLTLSSGWMEAIGAMVLLGLCAAPLATVRSQAAEIEVPDARRSEAFTVLFAAHSLSYGAGGLLLAVLPLRMALLAGSATGLFALLASPVLLRHRQVERTRSDSHHDPA